MYMNLYTRPLKQTRTHNSGLQYGDKGIVKITQIVCGENNNNLAKPGLVTTNCEINILP